MTTFWGYRRPGGGAGTRNYIAVISTVACANGVVNQIVSDIDNVVPIMHGHGCGRPGKDRSLHTKTLINWGKHPNAAAVLIVGLGCEGIKAEVIANEIAESGKRVEYFNIQESGGTLKSIEKGRTILHEMLKDVNKIEKEPIAFYELTIGLQCGGSDGFSGVTANVIVGLFSDWLIKQGGTVILTENTEMIGASHILQKRAKNSITANDIKEMIGRAEHRSIQLLGKNAIRAISPGNMDGGLSTIMEKSLGCIAKGGSTTINEVVSYADIPREKGLILMDGPGYDMESATGIVAGGAQIILFTTGRGTPFGLPMVPVCKIASNPVLYDKMVDDMDINAGKILSGEATLESIRDELIKYVREVASGQKTKAEINKQGILIYPYSAGPSL